MNIALNIVEDNDDVKNPGDALIYCVMKYITDSQGYKISTGEVDYHQLIICCPQCGGISSSAPGHRYNIETQTMTPSIVHNPCGWHGWLRNGIFSNA